MHLLLFSRYIFAISLVRSPYKELWPYPHVIKLINNILRFHRANKDVSEIYLEVLIPCSSFNFEGAPQYVN